MFEYFQILLLDTESTGVVCLSAITSMPRYVASPLEADPCRWFGAQSWRWSVHIGLLGPKLNPNRPKLHHVGPSKCPMSWRPKWAAQVSGFELGAMPVPQLGTPFQAQSQTWSSQADLNKGPTRRTGSRRGPSWPKLGIFPRPPVVPSFRFGGTEGAKNIGSRSYRTASEL